jgi:hypothetical protein
LGTVGSVWYRGYTADWSQLSRPLSRLLVLLTTLLLLVMPVTEHLCNWDHFLRGGPDVEFSLLAGLLFAAMVVLSMNETMFQPRTLQPTTMRPGMMHPAAVKIGASCDRAATSHALDANGSLHLNQSLHLWARTPLRAPGVDDSGSRASVPLRI